MAKRILIVDDSPFVLRLLRVCIEAEPDLGVCGEAMDGVDAVTKAQELEPDLIVLDFSMPRMNGFEAALDLQRLLPRIPKILFTLHKDEIPDHCARSVGISAVLSKADGMTLCWKKFEGCSRLCIRSRRKSNSP